MASIFDWNNPLAAAQAINVSAGTARTTLENAGVLANGTLQQGLNEGLGYLSQYTGQAQAAISPMTSGSYAALDSLFDLLGIQRSKMGSANYAQSTGKANELTNKIDSLKGQMNANPYVDEVKKWETNLAKANPGSKTYAETAANLARAKQSLSNYQASLNNQISGLSGQLDELNKTGYKDLTAGGVSEDTVNQLRNTPGYQFALDQGTDAIQSSAAARGMLNSGKTLKDLQSFGQGLADQTYNNAVNQKMQALGLTGGYLTQSANLSANQGQFGATGYLNTAGARAGNIMNTAESVGNILVGQGSALSGLYAGIDNRNAMINAAQSQGQQYNQGLLAGR